MLAVSILREAIRVHYILPAYTHRQAGQLIGSSHQSYGRTIKRIQANSVTYKDADKLDDDALIDKLYPNLKVRKSEKILPDFDEICKETSKRGKHKKTRKVLYLEYWLKYDKKAYKESYFYELVRKELKYRNVFMKQLFQPAEVLFCDYAGTRLKFIDSGKVKYLYVFVACFGYSKKLFAFATLDMTSKSWILALSKAFEHFGGVPQVIQFDNAKAMVVKAGMIAILNDNVKAFAEHNDCICDTSRVGTPSDNANAEAGVKFCSQRVLEVMNADFIFFSQVEANQHLLEEVEKLDAAPFQKRPCSSNELFEKEEKPALKPLPLTPFKHFNIRKTILVPSTYHIPYKGHEYSVPYTLVGKQVVVYITETEIIAKHKNILMAQHLLKNDIPGFTRLPQHMKPSHLAEENKSKETFMAWAHEIGRDVEEIIEKHYSFTSNAKSRAIGKRCIALQKLCDKCGKEIFSQACHYAIEHEWYEVSEIELVIRARAWESDNEPNVIDHNNIHGKDYFEGNSDE